MGVRNFKSFYGLIFTFVFQSSQLLMFFILSLCSGSQFLFQVLKFLKTFENSKSLENLKLVIGTLEMFTTVSKTWFLKSVLTLEVLLNFQTP